MTRLPIVAAALLLSGCLAMPTWYPKARGSLDRVEAGYARVREPAVLTLEALPLRSAPRARAALRLADAAIATLRRGAKPADRLRALRDLLDQAAILASLPPATSH